MQQTIKSLEAWEANYIQVLDSDPLPPYICNICWGLVTHSARIYHYNWHMENEHV